MKRLIKGKGTNNPTQTFSINERWPWVDRGLNQRNTAITVVLENQATLATSSALAETLVGNRVSLQNFGLYTDFAVLFDQYRFREVEVIIFPSCNTASTAGQEVGYYVTAVDLDNATAPASVASLSSTSGSVQSSVLSAHYHRFKPAIASNVYAGVFGSYGSMTDMWLDTGSTGVEQYGIKAALGITSTAIVFRIMWRAVVEFRGLNV